MTVNYEYFSLKIQIKLWKKPENFPCISFAILVSTWNFQSSEKKTGLIGQAFLKLFSPKYVLNLMNNRASFWKPFGSERVNFSPKLLKPTKKYFYPTFSSFWATLGLKKLFLIRSDILELLVNTLTTSYQYSRNNR